MKKDKGNLFGEVKFYFYCISKNYKEFYLYPDYILAYINLTIKINCSIYRPLSTVVLLICAVINGVFLW